jgi:hypothetical protein
MKQLYPQIDINDLIAEDFVGEDLIEKGKALPVGSLRTWGGREYVKHADGWVAVHSGRLTSGKDMKEVEGHHNAEDHATHARKYAAPKAESKPKSEPSKEPAQSKDSPQPDLMTQESEALKEYQGGMMNSAIGGYANIQSYLRTGKPKFGQFGERETELANRVSKLVSSAIKKHPLDKEMTVYRGMKIKEDDPTTHQYKNLKVGDTISDKAFTSTSTSKSVSDKFSEKLSRSDTPVSIEINLKPGDHALPMDKYHKGTEKEMLLDKDVKFKVIGIKESNGIKRIVLEIV